MSVLALNSHSLNLMNNLSESSIPNISNYSGFDYSFYNEAMEFVNETNDLYRSYCRDFYTSVREAANQEVINESFADFKTKVAEIIKRFLNFLKKLIDRFSVTLHKLVSSEKYLKANERKFAQFTQDDEFEITRYVYTFLDSISVPSTDALTDFDKEFGDIQNCVTNVNSKETDKEKLEEINKVYSDFTSGLTNFYDEFRGKVLSESQNSPKGAISVSDFDKEIFDTFRDGGDKQSVTVSPGTVVEALGRFHNYADVVKNVKSNKTCVERSYKEIQNKIEDLIKFVDGHLVLGKKDSTGTDTTYFTVTTEMTSKIELYIKAKSDQILNMSNIHTLAISGKLDAITECYKADKVLLYKALQKIEKHKVVYNSASFDDTTDLKLSLESLDEVREKRYAKLNEAFKEMQYNTFLIKEMFSQSNQSRLITESILEGTGIHLGVLTEAQKKQNIIQRIVAAIGRVWGKFTEWMNKLFKDDKAYLDKYKDIILKKKPKDVEISGWHNYKLNEFVNAAYPIFDFKTQKDALASKESWYEKLKVSTHLDIPRIAERNSDLSFSNNLKEYFMGEEVNIKASTLNMTNLYTYVYEFDSKTKPSLTKDINSINQASKNATALLDDVEEKKNEEETTSNESTSFDSFLSSFFNEDLTIGTSSSDNTNSGATTPNMTKSVGAQNKNIDNGENDTGEKRDQLRDNNNDAIKTSASEDKEAVGKAIELYFTTANEFLTGKLNFATEVYNAYFKVIRWHVQQFNNGAGKKTSDSYQKVGDDYSKQNNSNQDNEAPTVDTEGNGEKPETNNSSDNKKTNKSGFFGRRNK